LETIVTRSKLFSVYQNFGITKEENLEYPKEMF